MKPDRRQFLKTSLALSVSALGACGSPVTHDYRLVMVPGVVRAAGPLRLSIRSIRIPGYLDQNNIIKPGGAYEVNSFDDALWAEPFADMLQAVLVSDLTQRLAGAAVFADTAIGAPADAEVELDVRRFDFDPDGNINLTMQMAVKLNAAWHTQIFHAAAMPTGANVTAIVASMSELWGLGADQLARLVV